MPKVTGNNSKRNVPKVSGNKSGVRAVLERGFNIGCGHTRLPHTRRMHAIKENWIMESKNNIMMRDIHKGSLTLRFWGNQAGLLVNFLSHSINELNGEEDLNVLTEFQDEGVPKLWTRSIWKHARISHMT